MADTIGHEIEETQVSAVAWPAILAGGVASAALTLVLLAFGVGLGEDGQHETNEVGKT